MTELPRPRKRPKQSRSAELVRAIREACLQILDQEGPERLTTQRIADVAGVNMALVRVHYVAIDVAGDLGPPRLRHGAE